MKKINLLFYYLISTHFPNSWWPAGRIYNYLRIKCLKGIITIGDNCRIQRKVYIGDGNSIRIGNNCFINESVRLDNVSIGNDVMIARETVVLGKMHSFKRTDIPMIKQGVKGVKRTIIEDDVWIGLRVIILPGIHIAKGTIIAAGSVVTKDTEPFSIYGGVPASLIRKR